MIRVINGRTGQVFLSQLKEARGPWQKFAGLMFARAIGEAHGVLFRPAQGIHTHFMRFAIDLVYLDDAHRVQAIREMMPPWRFDFRSSAAVIETNAGAARAADIQVGDELYFDVV